MTIKNKRLSGSKILTTVIVVLLFSFNAFATVLNVRNFGARGDGKTDDTHAIQAAIDAAKTTSKTTVFFPKGIYLIGSYTITSNYFENYCIRIYSGIIFKGEGEKSVIKLANHIFDKPDTMANAHIFYGVNINDVQFSGLLINMNGENNLVPENIIKNHMAIFVYNGHNMKISNILIKNCAGQNMIAIKGNGHCLKIEKSSFLNGGNYVGNSIPNKYQIDFSFIFSEWDSTIITDNHIEQQNVDIALSNFTGGIEMHGSYCYSSRNTIIGCNPGFYISSIRYPVVKTTVTDNRLEQCLRGISFWVSFPQNNITISNNIIGLTYSRLLKTPLIIGIEVPNGNVEEYTPMNANNALLTNILITGNDISSSVNDTSKDKTVGILLHSFKDSKIKNNKIVGMNYGGIVLQGSKWGMESVMFNNNLFSNFKTNNDSNAVGGYVVVTDTYTNKHKNAPGLKKVYFINNTFINSRPVSVELGNKKVSQFFGAFIALPPSSIQEIHFNDNFFSDKAEKIIIVKTN